MTLHCDICKNTVSRLRCKNSVWYCLDCFFKRIPEQSNDTFAVIQKVKIGTYGDVSINRLKEIERRVILPYERAETKIINGKIYKSNSYYVGRRGDNGKIQERSPDYSK